MAEEVYDVIIIGGGPAGENVADRVVKGGLTAVLVESRLVGGECSFAACIPSKALLRSSAALEAARRVQGAREAVNGTVDAAGVFERRNRFTSGWRDDSGVKWLEKAGIAFKRGHGRISGQRKVDVSSDGKVTQLAARSAVVVCTGSQAAIPPIPGLAEARPWTNIEATSASSCPRRLAILGGGVVAVEMATAWRSLGVHEVTLIERGKRLLSRLEPFAGELVQAALVERGIKVMTRISVRRVRRWSPGTPIHLWVDRGGDPPGNADAGDRRADEDIGGAPDIEADELLVATGRVPASQHIGLDTVGLKPGSWLDVDDSCLVKAVPGNWLYAAGDINHRALVTHMGKYQARACGDAIVARAKGELGSGPPPEWSRWAASADHAAVPQVIFTDPEVAAVGLTEEEAIERGFKVRSVENEIGQVAGAQLFADGYKGRAKLVVDEGRRVILGATLVGAAAGELVHSFTVAIVGEVPLDRLWHAVPSFPTISEIWLRLLEAYGL